MLPPIAVVVLMQKWFVRAVGVGQVNWPYPPRVSSRAGKLAPENTLAAMRLGTVRLFDVRVRREASGDGVLLMHDATLDRTTDGTGRVPAARSELARLDAALASAEMPASRSRRWRRWPVGCRTGGWRTPIASPVGARAETGAAAALRRQPGRAPRCRRSCRRFPRRRSTRRECPGCRGPCWSASCPATGCSAAWRWTASRSTLHHAALTEA